MILEQPKLHRVCQQNAKIKNNNKFDSWLYIYMKIVIDLNLYLFNCLNKKKSFHDLFCEYCFDMINQLDIVFFQFQ